MKEFFSMMRRFVMPYKRYVGYAVILNILSALSNVFSFTLLIPILDILFQTGANNSVYEFMEWGSADIKDVAVNNFYYYITVLINSEGPLFTLFIIGVAFVVMTFVKTTCYFASSAVMIPLRTSEGRNDILPLRALTITSRWSSAIIVASLLRSLPPSVS